jgi:hypothetical protein
MNKAIVDKSQRLYAFSVKFYPKGYRKGLGRETQNVFSELLRDAYLENGESGVIRLWGKTIIDASKSIVKEHLENKKRNDQKGKKDTMMQNKAFLWIAMATGFILLIPLTSMRFNSEVNWTLFDFILMGTLLFGSSTVFVLTARRISKKYRAAIGIAFAAAILWLWAELAVGVFTNWGS